MTLPARLTVVASRENPQVKALRRLIAQPRIRRQEGRCWVEGPRMVETALARSEAIGWAAELVCVAVEADGQVDAPRQPLIDAAVAQGARVCMMAPAVFRALSDVHTDQGIGLVMAQHEASARGPGRALTAAPLAAADLVILDGLQDPGNVGTLIRTAAAAGVGQVLLTEGTAEAFSPKALRAGAGAQFCLPITESVGLPQVRTDLAARGASLVLTLPPHAPGVLGLFSGDVASRLSDPRPLAWVFGQEGQGVSTDWSAPHAMVPDVFRVTIPQLMSVESLNVTAAAAVLLFERLRCRRQQG